MEIKTCGNNKYVAILSKNDFEQYDLYPDEIISGEKNEVECLPIKEILEKLRRLLGINQSLVACLLSKCQ